MDLCFLPSLGFIANMPIIPSQRRLSGYRFFPPLEDEHEHGLSRPRGAENEVTTFIDPSSGSILFAEAAPGFVPDIHLAQAVLPEPFHPPFFDDYEVLPRASQMRVSEYVDFASTTASTTTITFNISPSDENVDPRLNRVTPRMGLPQRWDEEITESELLEQRRLLLRDSVPDYSPYDPRLGVIGGPVPGRRSVEV